MAQLPHNNLPSPHVLQPSLAFAHLVENSHTVLYRLRVDPSLQIEYINPAIRKLTGYSPQEFYLDPDLLERIIHPEDRFLHGDGSRSEGRPLILRWINRHGQSIWVEEERVPIQNQTGKTLAWEGMVRQITPSTAEQQIVERLTEQRKRLLNASDWVAAGNSMDNAVQRLLEGLQGLLDFDSCVLYLNGKKPGRLTPLNVCDPNSKTFQKPFHSPIDPTVIRSVYQTGQSEVKKGFISDVPGSTEPHWLAVPLPSQNHPLGVLTLSRQTGSPFCKQDLGLVQGVASYASLAIQNAQLIQEKQTRSSLVHNLTSFNRISSRSVDPQEVYAAICESARAISAAKGVALYHFDTQGNSVRHWSNGVSNSLTRRVALSLTEEVQDPLIQPPVLRLIPDTEELSETSFWYKVGAQEGIRAIAMCPLILENKLLARVDCYYPLSHDWSDAEHEALQLFSRQAAIALQNQRLYMDLEDSYLQTMLTLARVIDARDAYTARHSQKLAGWAEATASLLNCSPEEVRTIRWAAQLHDIGKIAVPDTILRKAGPLTDDEWVIMRRHPVIGAEIVSPLKRLEAVTPLIRAHQEKMDGTGYPDGLFGNQIPLGARILTVVDSFGAMTDDRIYRPALSSHDATKELKRCAGKHFDPQVVNVFSRIIEN